MYQYLFFIFFAFGVCGSYGIIYEINENEYYKMPPLFAMDDYDTCMLSPRNTYCLAVYELYSRGPSDLMHYIHEFSAHRIKHYNHTLAHRATCINLSRMNINNTLGTKPELTSLLEETVNKSIWNDYKIEAKLTKIEYCKNNNERIILDFSDYTVGVVYILIVVLNVIGSFYDVLICEKDSRTGNSYLLSFSLRRNWNKLMAPSGIGADPRLTRLKFFNGVKALAMICVLFAHTALAMSYTYIQNPLFVEKAYDDLSRQALFSGTVITLAFFVMSSFLLAYNLQIYAEKQKITWTAIPKGFILRWLRLTPPYALVIATISTWMRHIGSGPLWDMIVTSESVACRQYWWAHLFYFNNYINRQDTCLTPSWYLAADTQLFCLALILLVIIQDPWRRKITLVLLFLLSILITAATTYYWDLDAIFIQSPEAIRSLFSKNETYNLTYIPGHTNLSVYVLGLAAGFYCYEWQTNKKDFSKYKKYGWLVWFTVPLGWTILLSGAVNFIDGYTPSILLRVVYSILYKHIFQALLVATIITSIFKLENVYRGILEWNGLTWAGRVTYSAYLLHTIFQRSFIGSLTTPLVLSDFFVLVVLCASVVAAFGCGTLLWLFVEAPVAGLLKALFASKNKESSS